MLNLLTINVCIYKYKSIKIVNINTKTNNHACIILTNRTCTMYRYGLHTARLVVFEHSRIPPSSSCSSDEMSPRRNGRRRNVPATRWLHGDQVYPRRNGCMATKCTRDETEATKRRRRNGSDEMSCSEGRWL